MSGLGTHHKPAGRPPSIPPVDGSSSPPHRSDPPNPADTRALAEAEARWRSWFEHAPGFVCIFSGPQHRHDFVNRRWRQLVGRRELLGRTLLQALPEMAGQSFLQLLDRVIASGEPQTGNALLLRLEGDAGDADQLRYMDAVLQPACDAAGAVTGILMQGTDVTDRVLAAAALAASEARYRALAEQLPGGAVFVVDADLRFVMVAGEALAGAGFAAADLLGRTIFDAMEPALARVAEGHYRRALAGQTFELEHAGGNGRFFLTRGAPLRGAQGQIYGVLAVSFDITSRRRAEESLRRSDRHKDEFLAVLAHELRNPLAPLLSAARVLQQPALPDAELARCRDVIGRQVQQMALLLDDLLDVSRVKHGRLRLNRGPVALADVIGAAVETVTPLIDSRQHQLSLALPAHRVLLHADAGRLAQVLANLLGNAAKYTEPGGRIELAAEPRGEMLEITVRDNGIGLSAADQSRVFSMFTQIEHGAGHTQGGLGIGLALVKGLVELHGGSVRVASAGPGQGSAFTVSVPTLAAAELPAAAATPDTPGVVAAPGAATAPVAPVAPVALATPAAPATPEEPSEAAQPNARWRILVADDNGDAAETLAMFLRLDGHETFVVADGLQAVAAQARLVPDVALIDIGMPGLNGYQVARRIRASAGTPPPMLVALTGWGQEGDKRKASDAGFDLHFTKPVDPAELMRSIARHLGVDQAA